MDPAKGLVLTTQLTALRNSFMQLGGGVKSAHDRRQEVDALRTSLQSIFASVDDPLGYRLNVLEPHVEAGKPREGMASLRQVRKEMKALKKALQDALNTVEAMYARSAEVYPDFWIDGALKQEIETLAERIANDLNRLQGQVVAAAPPDAAANGGGSDSLLRAWEKYKVALSEPLQELLAEYVEFLAGLALRNAGMDQGTCQIADHLVQTWDETLKVNWASLTIPSFREAETMTPARIIRLGFPEWSIWALPLIAHEFGHIVIATKATARDLVPADFQREELAADAFATHAMGPAYACAAILLRFNPLTAYASRAEHLASVKRAAVIFATLERMDMNNGQFSKIIQQLRGEWTTALEQAQALAPDAERDADAADLDAWLHGEQTTWLNAFLEYLADKTTLIYSGNLWAKARKWTDGMIAAGDTGAAIKPQHSDTLVDVLNAAWYSRITHPTQIDTIDGAARSLAATILGRDHTMKLGGSPLGPGSHALPDPPRKGHR